MGRTEAVRRKKERNNETLKRKETVGRKEALKENRNLGRYGDIQSWQRWKCMATIQRTHREKLGMSPVVVPRATMPDFSPVCSIAKNVTVKSGGDDDDVIISEEPVLVVNQKVYDVMDDLLESDPLQTVQEGIG